MYIGKLNKRVTFQKHTTITTPNGFEEEEEKWIDYKTVWASINNLWGKEYWSAKAVQSENTVEFIVRYSKDLDLINSKEYRLYWNNKTFNITSIDNIKYENRWIKIKAIEVL